MAFSPGPGVFGVSISGIAFHQCKCTSAHKMQFALLIIYCQQQKNDHKNVKHPRKSDVDFWGKKTNGKLAFQSVKRI